MLICSSLDEVKRREAALRFIASLVNQEGKIQFIRPFRVSWRIPG